MTTTPTTERDDGEIEDVAIAISGVFQSGGAGNLAIASAAIDRLDAYRAAHAPKVEARDKAIVAKQTKNEGRTWPDWRTMREDQAIEHDRTKDDAGSI